MDVGSSLEVTLVPTAMHPHAFKVTQESMPRGFIADPHARVLHAIALAGGRVASASVVGSWRSEAAGAVILGLKIAKQEYIVEVTITAPEDRAGEVRLRAAVSNIAHATKTRAHVRTHTHTRARAHTQEMHRNLS